jgi:hypothetical protein
MCWKDLAEWLTGAGTLTLAVVAVFQDWIRQKVWRPRLALYMTTEPPDCKAVPEAMFKPGTSSSLPTRVMVNSVYVRMRVGNNGNAPAINAEVYADALSRKRADGGWEKITAFPPMNLSWSDIGPSLGSSIYFPRISPGMTKHCDVAAIYDPSGLAQVDGTASSILGETKLTFCLVSRPNHFGHIVGPGTYRLFVYLAAENAKPVRRCITIQLPGKWYADEAAMLRDGIGITVEDEDRS